MDTKQKRVGIIGAGVAGLLSIKCCLEEGLIPVCFEQHDKLGGTWYYTEHERENQTASVYQNMIMNDVKERFSFSDFPVPDHYPQYCNIYQYYEYLTAYVEHFDLARHILFNQCVTKVKKAADYATTGQWEVFTKSADKEAEERHVFDGIALCSGALKNGRIPDIPGLSNFKGKMIHSTQYRKPEDFAGQEVLVVGGRYSASDQACDLIKQTKQVYLSSDRGLHIVPASIQGRGVTLYQQRRLMMSSEETIGKAVADAAAGYLNHAAFGLDTSQNPLTDGNFAVSDELVYCLLNGRIKLVPRVKSFTEDSVVYDDGTTQKIDAVVLATGYCPDYGFVDCPDIQGNKPGRFKLYKDVFPLSCTHPTLAVVSCGGLLGVYAFFTEIAARWMARVFAGACKLPSKDAMTKFTDDSLKYYQEKCRGRHQSSEFKHAEELASEIGVRPDLHRLIFSDPVLAYKVYFGPPIPAHYRLVGPGARQSCWEHTHQFYDSLYPNDISNKMRSATWHGLFGSFLAIAAYVIKSHGSQFF